MLKLIARVLTWRAAVNEARAKALVAYADTFDETMKARGQRNATIAHVSGGLSILAVAFVAAYLGGML